MTGTHNRTAPAAPLGLVRNTRSPAYDAIERWASSHGCSSTSGGPKSTTWMPYVESSGIERCRVDLARAGIDRRQPARPPEHNEGMWRRYAVASWLGVALLAGCGADRIQITDGAARTSGHGPAGQGPALTPATESAHSLTPDTATLLAVADANGQPLTREIRLRGGSIVIGPPADAARIRVTAAQARQTVLAEPGASDPASLICRSGSLTFFDDGASDDGSTSANSTLDRSGAEVWMCVWVNAIVGPSDTPRQHENIIAFVDATTGDALLTIADTT